MNLVLQGRLYICKPAANNKRPALNWEHRTSVFTISHILYVPAKQSFSQPCHFFRFPFSMVNWFDRVLFVLHYKLSLKKYCDDIRDVFGQSFLWQLDNLVPHLNYFTYLLEKTTPIPSPSTACFVVNWCTLRKHLMARHWIVLLARVSILQPLSPNAFTTPSIEIVTSSQTNSWFCGVVIRFDACGEP